MNQYIVTFIILLLFSNTYAELYTSTAHLEELLHSETILLKALNKYIVAQETKLDLLKTYSETYRKYHYKAKQNPESYVTNPINAYLFVKRLTEDWKNVERLIYANIGHDDVSNIIRHKELFNFPTDVDLNGAVEALTRLQDTYKLDTASLAKGEINGVKYSSELSASDCFELGKHSYINENFDYTYSWMLEAGRRLQYDTYANVETTGILEYLASSAYRMGETSAALHWINKLLEIVPGNKKALKNKSIIENILIKNTTAGASFSKSNFTEENTKKESVHNATESSNEDREDKSENIYEFETYEKLCRGEVSTPDNITSKLKCMYANNNNPFLKIAPFKLEEAYDNPKIAIFHNVISNDEINTIKEMAYTRFQRATVASTKTKSDVASYRICKTAWLKKTEHKHLSNLVQRIEDMTGLSMETAELLQVANYGIGGHYMPHYDMSTRAKRKAYKEANLEDPIPRVATVLFYLTDVVQGGATVFPHLKTAIWPKKGTATFWYNMYSSGDGIKATLHAGCPVLVGSKWITNEWIREEGQVFRRPCNLTRPPIELTI